MKYNGFSIEAPASGQDDWELITTQQSMASACFQGTKKSKPIDCFETTNVRKIAYITSLLLYRSSSVYQQHAYIHYPYKAEKEATLWTVSYRVRLQYNMSTIARSNESEHRRSFKIRSFLAIRFQFCR